jgi:hypothetical protein
MGSADAHAHVFENESLRDLNLEQNEDGRRPRIRCAARTAPRGCTSAQPRLDGVPPDGVGVAPVHSVGMKVARTVFPSKLRPFSSAYAFAAAGSSAYST